MSKLPLNVRLERGGPFTSAEVTTITRNSKFDMIEIEGKYYNEWFFNLQAKAAYAKSVVFAAAATVAIKSKEYIWAAIASYYALFHLSIALMFLLPRELRQGSLVRLTGTWAGGSQDPTRLIPHRDLSTFLRTCETKGLKSTCRTTLEAARTLRDHVNYGPRIAWVNDKAIFKSLTHSTTEVESVVTALESILANTILWASTVTEFSWVRTVEAAVTLHQFLTADDLLYVHWCSTGVLEEARGMAQRLPSQLELWHREV